MEALITLYTRATGIEAEKLQMIEDIEAYLTAKEPTAPTYTIQYQKIRLNMSVKIILNESYASPLQANNYTYVKIINKDNLTKPFYFFVKTLNWKSQSCIELDLVLDTLNSFKMGTDYTFSPKTIIQRQHKDRIQYTQVGDILDLRNTSITPETPMLNDTEYRTAVSDLLSEFTPVDSLGESVDNAGTISIFTGAGIPKIYKMNFSYFAITERYESLSPKTMVITDSNGDDHTYHFEDNDTTTIVLISLSTEIDLEYSAFINDDVDETSDYQDSIFQYNYATDGYFQFMRKVDLMNEDLNPQLYGNTPKTIEDGMSSKESWYLVYDTIADTDVVEAYLIPENNTGVSVTMLSMTGGVISPDSLNSGYTHILLNNLTEVGGDDQYFNGMSYGASNFKLSNGSSIPTLAGYENCILELSQSGDKILGSVIVFTLSDDASYKLVKQGLSFITDYIQYIGNESSIQYNYNSTSLDLGNTKLSDISNTLTYGYTYSTGGVRTLGSIYSLDRTQATLLKIIKMPYTPYEFETDGTYLIVNNDFYFVDSWKGITNVLKLKDLNVDLRHMINTPSDDEIKSPIEETMRITSFDELISNRNDFYESKLFHSEFYTPKFTYDSFSLIYKLELVNVEKWLEYTNNATQYLDVRFVMSRTINSRFAFEFLDYIVDKREDDYPNWLLVSRNNEEVIYNSSYLNYIRTGYNYDVKNKQAQATRNWISIGASALTAVVGIVGSFVTGGASAPLAIMGVSGIISTSATITNAISTQAQNERSIQEKLDTLKLQTASVSGSDDVDLMTRYNGNRLLYLTYKVNERVEKLLKDLFYYYGYKDNVTGIPNTNTRYWFNHLKCEPILEFTSINMTQEIEDELKGIMRNGFTIYHKRLVGSVATWDIDQVKENWEVSMLPYLS